MRHLRLLFPMIMGLILAGCQVAIPNPVTETPSESQVTEAITSTATVTETGDITSTEDIAPAGETAVDILLAALERQKQAAAIVSDPALGKDIAAIRTAITSASPHLLWVSAQLGFSQVLVEEEAAQHIASALAEEGTIMALAPLILLPTSTEQEALRYYEELLVHGGAALGAINIALSTLGAGPSAAGSGHLMQPDELQVPDGYTAEIVANELNFATVVTVAEDGTVYVAEAGYSYGNIRAPARVLRVLEDSTTEVIAEGFQGPVAGLAVHEGQLFVSHQGTITRVDLESGEQTDIVTELPSQGDHFNENIAIGSDGKLYFTQGSATNSGVVGPDNYMFGWLPQHPEFHDIPCRDLTLAGTNYTTGNPLTGDITDAAETGAYLPFGTPSEAGQVVEGETKCSGAVLRVDLDGANLEVVADGFRNPYGLALHPDGRLFVTENGPDSRGSRPVSGPDNFYEVIEGGWYGWPDFYGGVPVTDKSRQPHSGEAVQPVLQNPPELAMQPLARFEHHVSANGFDFASADSFAPVGQAYVAQFGDLTPPTAGGHVEPAGQQVVLVTPDGEVQPFLTSATGDDGRPFLRPTDATFDPVGEVLYVTHFGEVKAIPGGIVPTPGTGALIRITR